MTCNTCLKCNDILCCTDELNVGTITGHNNETVYVWLRASGGRTDFIEATTGASGELVVDLVGLYGVRTVELSEMQYTLKVFDETKTNLLEITIDGETADCATFNVIRGDGETQTLSLIE